MADSKSPRHRAGGGGASPGGDLLGAGAGDGGGPPGDDGRGDEESAAPSRRPGGRALVSLGVAAAVAAAAVGAVVMHHDSRSPGRGTASTPVQTVAVVRTDLSSSQSLSGTLGFGKPVTVKGAGTGTVTQLPAQGENVSRGRPLLRVDDHPVMLFYGSTPLFRPLDRRGLVGRDVAMVAANLKALGYDIGAQPSVGSTIRQADAPAAGSGSATSGTDGSGPGHGSGSGSGASSAPGAGSGSGPASATAGTTAPPGDGPPAAPPASPTTVVVRRGDGVLTSSLMAALKRFQRTFGLPATGTLSPGDVVVLPGRVRVSGVQAALGDPAAEPLMSVTLADKTVTVPADPDAVSSIKENDRVVVTLPDSSTTPGHVATVSATVQEQGSAGGGSGDDSGNAPQQNVSVALDRPADVRNLDSAPVQVEFTGKVEKGVLAVPVGALLALSGGGYAVQLRSGTLVAVRLGMFAKGLVEITGTGITAGTRVVTAA
ncbi:peptidoglycan-binding protein [Streptomyces sp. NPDC088197]|uniref:peptidoglycan-binding protein n=1 Tax=Streptomyces sp. NPDC088197 TaxID=3365840 RepID=UPI0037FC255C